MTDVREFAIKKLFKKTDKAVKKELEVANDSVSSVEKVKRVVKSAVKKVVRKK